MEKETLKEVAEKLASTTEEFNMFIAGAKWQAEQMYSEEEVKSILLKTDRFLRADLDIWFEQFKK
jgi:hypothetical protein